jgi:hypothetical protein
MRQFSPNSPRGAEAKPSIVNGQCRPEANEAKRAHARWLAVKIAIKAQYGANQGRSAEPQGDVEGVHSGVIYWKRRLDTRSEQKRYWPILSHGGRI